MPDGRVLIAFDDTMLEPSPTWSRIDDTDNLVAGIDIHRGKQTERDRTDTGTATVYLNDTEGLFDPNNTGSPYFGKLDGKQIMLQCWNPVTSEWVTEFRGFINDYGYDINPATDHNGFLIVANIQVDCVDLFDFLGGYELIPGHDGKAAATGPDGSIHYYGGTDPTSPQAVDDRITEVLMDCGVDSTMWVVFSGNVNLQPSTYDATEPALNVLRDCADAELPGIANIYMDKLGRFAFHGRYSRFSPDLVAADATPGAWNFTRWKAGDGRAIALDSDRAQMRVLSYSRARSEIINSGLSYPRGIAEPDIPGQVYRDATSVTAYGLHSWSAPDLVINAGTTSGDYPPVSLLSSANHQCFLFSKFFVKNQKDPGNRIKALTIKMLDPGDPRAAATWGVLCGADISDIINLTVGYPGGTGIDDVDYYVEGVTMRIRPLNPTYDHVELDLDVSPAEWSMDTHGVFS